MTETQNQMAAGFRALHAAGNLLVLPNAWDVASARIVEDCGAAAIATSSAAVAWANGYPDGEALPKERLLGLVADIVRVAKVPVTADSEAGYDASPEDVAGFVVRLAKAGAVGINLEDGAEPPALLADKIRAIKAACKRDGVDVFINARTDVYLKALAAPEQALAETLARGKLYAEAGADGFFVPWASDIADIAKVVEAIALPLNALVFRNLPPVSALKDAGVRRLSAGAGMSRAAYGALRRSALALLDEQSFETMNREADGCPNLNALLVPR